MKLRAGPDGIYAFNRRTGFNILFDEIHVPMDAWASAPRQVSIALTNACDLACPYCYAPKFRAALNFEVICPWLVELDTNGCIGIGFGGGEPTLYPYFVELCKYTMQETNLAVTFTTHSHHLSDKLLSNLAGHVHFVRVSMDGVGSTYETLRGRPFSAFCKQLEVVRQLAPFGINFVVNAQTISDLDAAATLAVNAGAVEFLLLPEHPVKGSPGIDEHTALALREWVNQYEGPLALRVSEFGADGLPTCDPFINETGLRAYAHIDAVGNIKRSSFDNVSIPIKQEGVMDALEVLRAQKEG